MELILLLITTGSFVGRFSSGSGILLNLWIFTFLVITIIYLYQQKGSTFISLYYRNLFKILILISISILVIISFANLLSKRSSQKLHQIHDSVIQTEVALDYLSRGLNPYTLDYRGTALEPWYIIVDDKHVTNPALDHYAYLPSTLYISYPFYTLILNATNYYDQRIVLLFSLIITLGLLIHLGYKKENIILIAPLFLLNPFLTDFLSSGYNDVLPLTLIILTLYFIIKKKYSISIIFLALAITSKQTAWFAVPFILLYLWKEYIQLYTDTAKKKFIYTIATLATLSLILILPFLISDAGNFINDTVGYITGYGNNPYPIRGIGFGQLLYSMGVISSRYVNFPFWLIQALVGLPTLWYLLKSQWQAKINEVHTILLNWTIWLGIIWFFSRYFTLSHLSFIITLASLTYLLKIFTKKEIENDAIIK